MPFFFIKDIYFFLFFECAIAHGFINACWIKRNVIADIYRGHQKAVTAMLTVETPANSSWQASSYQQSGCHPLHGPFLAFFQRQLISAVRPQQFCVTLKTPWFSYWGCLSQPQSSLPVLLQGGCRVDNLHSALQLLCMLSIPAACLKSSASLSASPSTPFASSKSADVPMLHTAMQWMHKSPTYLCIYAQVLQVSQCQQHRAFTYHDLPFYRLVWVCCLVIDLAALV